MEKEKIVFKGSHPDSLYRVSPDGDASAGKVARSLRLLRWPLALLTLCIALAVFVYFLMPVNMNVRTDLLNATYWEDSIPEAQSHGVTTKVPTKPANDNKNSRPIGSKTSEIDFYDADSDNRNDLPAIIHAITETSPNKKLPIPPVFPTHISLEVQYGNEKADTDKVRVSKVFKELNSEADESTLKPHITQKPEKPLAIYFKDGNGITTSTEGLITESFTNAETSNDIAKFLKKQTNKFVDPTKPPQSSVPTLNKNNIKQHFNTEPDLPPEVQEYYVRPAASNDIKFTSGHSKFFGISIEDSHYMKSTTQNSLYNTRVSPTLPTWKDRDGTTKKYPINSNFDGPLCRSTRLSLCRGVLPYDLAGAPAQVGLVDVTTLLPQIEYLVSTNCSERVRHFACSLLEPECSPPPYSSKLPCYNFCKAITDSCEGMIPTELQAMFSCNQYSSSNCFAARAPCLSRELRCGDGSCVPRDWVCDGTRDCPAGDDEQPCAACSDMEYRCSTGICINKRWLCDGYADCTNGEDEKEELCRGRRKNGTGARLEGFTGAATVGDGRARLGVEDIIEPGEEPAGSAPAPSVRKPNRFALEGRNGDNESSKELLMTSDSGNGLRRNFTRRPSPSRLKPYKRLQVLKPIQDKTSSEETGEFALKKSDIENYMATIKPGGPANKEDIKQDDNEELNMEEIGLFDIERPDGIRNESKIDDHVNYGSRKAQKPNPSHVNRPKPKEEPAMSPVALKLDQSMNKLERVIDGAAMLRNAAKEHQKDLMESAEMNGTMADRTEELGYNGAHASPCPSSELRCVDGRCITLAQLCDGTIDCSDHADEDNCYT